MADWEKVTDPLERRKVLGKAAGNIGSPTGGVTLSKTDQAAIQDLRVQSQAADETQRVYRQAAGSVKRLQPGPYRGAFLSAALPDEGGGFLDSLGAAVVGGPARLLGAIDNNDINDYQRLKGLQAGNVLTRQLEQKGPQTDTDAARLQLTEISPSKTPEANQAVIDSGLAKTNRAKAKVIFYNQFAQKFGGLNALSPHGYTVDQLWQHDGDRMAPGLLGQKQNSAPAQIKVLSRRKVGP